MTGGQDNSLKLERYLQGPLDAEQENEMRAMRILGLMVPPVRRLLLRPEC
jgi:hypothetical protein